MQYFTQCSASTRALVSCLLLCGATCGCSSKKDTNPFDIGAPQGGVRAVFFQSLEDYLSHPTVTELLGQLGRTPGNTPTDVEGTFEALTQVVSSTIPGVSLGDQGIEDFCFGLRSGQELGVVVASPILEQAGARYFIEGTGDLFTVFAAFRSIQRTVNGGVCEIHQVNIYTGRREPNGNLAELSVGFGIVGLIGVCDGLLVGDTQISEAVGPATLVAPGGGFDPNERPSDPSRVLVIVDNLLDISIAVIFNAEQSGNPSFLDVGANTVSRFEVLPGFSLSFVALNALLVDVNNQVFTGVDDLFQGTFPTDCTPAGAVSEYIIENQVSFDVFFAPQPINRTAVPIDVDVNGLFCGDTNCLPIFPTLPPTPANIGYYFYDIPRNDPVQDFPPQDVDILVTNATSGVQLERFIGGETFDLDAVRPGSGIVELDVDGLP